MTTMDTLNMSKFSSFTMVLVELNDSALMDVSVTLKANFLVKVTCNVTVIVRH